MFTVFCQICISINCTQFCSVSTVWASSAEEWNLIGKDCDWNGNRLSENDQKLTYLHWITKTVFLLVMKTWNSAFISCVVLLLSLKQTNKLMIYVAGWMAVCLTPSLGHQSRRISGASPRFWISQATLSSPLWNNWYTLEIFIGSIYHWETWEKDLSFKVHFYSLLFVIFQNKYIEPDHRLVTILSTAVLYV